MILKSGYTQNEIVDMMSTDFGWSGSPSNFSRILNEGTLRYDQALELAKALGYEIRWEKVRGAND